MHNLIKISIEKLKEKNLADEKHKIRLKEELNTFIKKGDLDYYLKIYKKGLKHIPNENNLLTPYLLGICDEFNIDEDCARTSPELPDIDTDFIRPVRDYLKQEWAPKVFGEECVSNISTYTTYDIKISLLDMARIFGKDFQEAVKVTKQLPLKDDEGDKLTWDKALELFPAFKKYTEKYPEVADAAKRLCHRNRSLGTHAGGLIIADRPLSNFVPVLLGKDQKIQTAWVEGQASQDLQAVGLIKFDLLVINNLMQIAICVEMIRQKYGVKEICNFPNRESWSDIGYLNDKKALDMANRGDLIGIFQFDSSGIRQLVHEGGVDRFDDLVAYSSVYRPASLSANMHKSYCNRKNGKEEWSCHELVKPFMEQTYDILIYQEQVMRMLNVVGDIPLDDCEEVRKAISKKKIEKFKKYKDRFIKNGKKRIGYSEEEMNKLWDLIEAFSGYSFNKSHAVAYTYISSKLLYLKAHYPEEFYNVILHCTTGADKYKKLSEYKREAEKHGVKINKINLNKSGIGFVDFDENGKIQFKDGIYFGFEFIKGIGEEAARKIVDGQPYNCFEDFLNRFGTDAKVIPALIALGVFQDAKPIVLYKYYEFYKDYHKKRMDRRKRFDQSMERYDLQIKELSSKFEIDKIFRRKEKSISVFNDKERKDRENPVTLNNFRSEFFKIDKDMEELLLDPEKAELAYYGFIWTHPLEKCELFERKNVFEQFQSEDLEIGLVDVLVKDVKEKTAAKNKNFKYYSLLVEDYEHVEGRITVWMDDYNRWKQELQIGNLIRIQLTPPDPRYRTYTLKSPPRHQRHTLPPKHSDARLILLEVKEEKEEQLLEVDFGDIDMTLE